MQCCCGVSIIKVSGVENRQVNYTCLQRRIDEPFTEAENTYLHFTKHSLSQSHSHSLSHSLTSSLFFSFFSFFFLVSRLLGLSCRCMISYSNCGLGRLNLFTQSCNLLEHKLVLFFTIEIVLLKPVKLFITFCSFFLTAPMFFFLSLLCKRCERTSKYTYVEDVDGNNNNQKTPNTNDYQQYPRIPLFFHLSSHHFHLKLNAGLQRALSLLNDLVPQHISFFIHVAHDPLCILFNLYRGILNVYNQSMKNERYRKRKREIERGSNKKIDNARYQQETSHRVEHANICTKYVHTYIYI